jgi:hypothetical protein
MGIKRYTANKDNTITNAFEENLTTRGTGSNMGASDVLEVFSIYGQSFSSGSTTGITQTQELSRILVEFPVSDIIADRISGHIPISGNVDFYLCMYNAKHGQTVPKYATYTVVPVSSSWEEGFGLDMENYQDLTNNQEGSNWIKRAGNNSWDTIGGTFLTASAGNNYGDRRKEVTLEKGTEDLKIDITDEVERWIKGTLASGGYPNYGLGIYLTASQEAYYSSSAGTFSKNNSIQNVSGATRSYYTKRFFSRTSQFFHKRPAVEARWDSSIKDNRGNVQYSSSLLNSSDNLNTLYLYNFVNGQLKNIPGVTGASEEIYVQLFSGSDSPTGSAVELVTTTDYTTVAVPTVITGGYVSTGIYSASFALTASTLPLTTVFDVWALDGGNKLGTQVFTGSSNPKVFKSSTENVPNSYVININNLKPSYNSNEIARFRVFTRLKDWNPTIYTKATSKVENYILDNMYFKINRTIDDEEIIPYGTGSTAPQANGVNGSYTRLSYDISGSYFDLDMSMLEPGYMYYTQIAYYDSNSYKQFNQTFNFKVDGDGY